MEHPCDHLPSRYLCNATYIMQCNIERCVSVLQPTLGVSSLDLGRPSGRPLFAESAMSISEPHDDLSRALARSAAATNPRLPWWALLVVLIPLLLIRTPAD